MFESIKRKLEAQSKESDPKNMSLDFKLMFVYHIVMMILFGTRPLDNPIHQAYLAACLASILIIVSSVHKLKANWSWPGLSFTSIPSLALNMIFIYVFLAFSSYAITTGGQLPSVSVANIEALAIESWSIVIQAASIPTLTPWFLGAVGIAFMNSMVSLKLATLTKSEFETQCNHS